MKIEYVGRAVIAVLAAAVIFIIGRNFDIFVEGLLFVALAGFLGAVCYWLVAEAGADKTRLQWLATAFVVVAVLYIGTGYTIFDVKIHDMERDFCYVADHASYDVVYDKKAGRTRLDYNGQLTLILNKRDEYLARWHREMHGIWRVSTGSGSHTDATYHWVPFGWGLKDP